MTLNDALNDEGASAPSADLPADADTPVAQANCPLCATPGGDWVFNCSKFRVIEALDPEYPGFLRLIWNEHVREFSDLSREDRMLCMDAVVLLEQFALRVFKADKANIATLGNVVPHLHWHVIPRFTDDKHFPAPVWATAKPGVSLSPRQQLVLDSKPKWMQVLRAELHKAFPN